MSSRTRRLAASILRSSSRVSRISAAPAFSAAWAGRFAPGIGTTSGSFASHARATAATVLPRAFAIPRSTRSTLSASFRL